MLNMVLVVKNKSDKELIEKYQKLILAQDYIKFDVETLMILNVEDHYVMTAYNKINEKLEETTKELYSRGILKNKLIIPTFE